MSLLKPFETLESLRARTRPGFLPVIQNAEAQEKRIELVA